MKNKDWELSFGFYPGILLGFRTYVEVNKRNHVLPTVDLGTPSVTIQLPIYNEKYVAKRLVDAVCNISMPVLILQ